METNKNRNITYLMFGIFILVMFSMIILIGVPTNAGIAGTDTIIYTFEKCDSLRVNVSGELQIDEGEYSILGCSETDTNSWLCDCEDDYDLMLSTTIMTSNTYTFTIQHNYSENVTQTITTGGGSSSGSACFERWECGEWDQCSPDGTQTRECEPLNACTADNPESSPATVRECTYVQPEDPAQDDGGDNQDDESATDPDSGTDGVQNDFASGNAETESNINEESNESNNVGPTGLITGRNAAIGATVFALLIIGSILAIGIIRRKR